MTTTWHLVEIELKRVQTYLFEVPRLSVMAGANALLGETLRGFWHQDRFDVSVPSLPGLAHECGSRWPEGLPVEFSPVVKPAEDPLRWKTSGRDIWQDDVAAVAEKTGVLTRDGGHFEALFATSAEANAFVKRAWALIQDRLPGVILQTRVSGLRHDGSCYRQENSHESRPATQAGVSLLDLPQARVCEYSGEGPASVECLEGDDTDAPPVISKSAADRHERGRAFDRGQTRDVLGILRPGLLRGLGFPETSQRALPADFTELSTKGYLAVIHVDGNRVGSRFTAYAKAAGGEDFFECWRLREKFYLTLRIGMRIAVTEALTAVFGGQRSRAGKVPARLLMLGGDDLVMVCGAALALPFVVELARRVRETTKNLPDQKGPMTLGAGVAIVQDSFPFYRAYELAEQLASSAKRLKSSLPDAEGNVVDWLATSEAWYGDVEATRRDQYLVDDQLVLSAKPYRILKSPGLTGKSLEELLADADQLAADRVARNQLHGLADSLRLGRHTATFAADVLPATLKSILTAGGYLSGNAGPWTELRTAGASGGKGALPVERAGKTGTAKDEPGQRFLTHLLDLFELYELKQLDEQAQRVATLGRSVGVQSSHEAGAVPQAVPAGPVAGNEVRGAR